MLRLAAVNTAEFSKSGPRLLWNQEEAVSTNEDLMHEHVSTHEYEALGEQFESIERKTFGGDNFNIYVDKIAALENQLGIYDLNQFTPK